MSSDIYEPQPHDPKSGISPFLWILMEAARIRVLRQRRNYEIMRSARDMELAWKKPIWDHLDRYLDRKMDDSIALKKQQGKDEPLL